MTENERMVAEAAIMPRPARTDGLQLAQDIADDLSRAGVTIDKAEISRTLEDLLKRGILASRARGARNIAARESPQGLAVAWYEKGAQWDQQMHC